MLLDAGPPYDVRWMIVERGVMCARYVGPPSTDVRVSYVVVLIEPPGTSLVRSLVTRTDDMMTAV